MEDLETDIPDLVHALTHGVQSGPEQRALVDQYFTSCAGFSHPLCRVSRRAATVDARYAEVRGHDLGSREEVKHVYAVYKALTRDIQIDIVGLTMKIHDEDDPTKQAHRVVIADGKPHLDDHLEPAGTLSDPRWRSRKQKTPTDNIPPPTHRYLLAHDRDGRLRRSQVTPDGFQRVLATATCVIDLRESLSVAVMPSIPAWFARIYNLRLMTTLSLVKLSVPLDQSHQAQARKTMERSWTTEAYRKEAREHAWRETEGQWYVTYQHDAFPMDHLANLWAWPAIPFVFGYRAYLYVGGQVGSIVGNLFARTGIW